MSGIVAIDPPEDTSAVRPIKAAWNGAVGSGRSSFLMTFLEGEFPTDYVPTIYDVYQRFYSVDSVVLRVDFWDTQAGRGVDSDSREWDLRLRSLAINNTDVVFLVVDASRRETLAEIEERWLPHALSLAPRARRALLVLKTDVRDDAVVLDKLAQRGETVVSAEEAEAFGARLGLEVIQVSAKTGDGMPQFTDKLVRLALTPPPPEPEPPKPESRLAAFFGRLFGTAKPATAPPVDPNPAFKLSR